jgi:1-acyl-sn-glycerol-3-phosphate acyltransferase
MRSHLPMGRRLVSIPSYLVAAGLVWISLPILVAVTFLADLLLRRRLLLSRLLLLVAVYLACEIAGLAAAFGLYAARAVWPPLTRERFLDAHWRLQAWWAGTLFAAIRRILQLRVRVEGAESTNSGPLLVFIRHASILDTLLPSVVVAGSGGLRLRYILKKELLWDPCLDVVGKRLPNAFVDRESPDSRAEIDLVCALAAELGPSDGILIYPEGTRFTPAKRSRALDRLAGSGSDLLSRAERLRHVLPPKLGGPLGLLEASPSADVLFVAHVGLDGLSRVRHLLDPNLVGRRLEIKIWRVARSRIPAKREERGEWLFEEWARVDEWIDERLQHPHT